MERSTDLTEEKGPLPPTSHVLANIGIAASQLPSTQTHLQRMWSTGFSDVGVLVSSWSICGSYNCRASGTLSSGNSPSLILWAQKVLLEHKAGRCEKKMIFFLSKVRSSGNPVLHWLSVLYTVSLVGVGMLHPSIHVHTRVHMHTQCLAWVQYAHSEVLIDFLHIIVR